MRRRILQAARELHAASGLAALSMRRVGSALNVSATAIYRHYRDKEDLMEAISDEGFDLLVAQLQRANRARTPQAACLRVLTIYLDFALAEPRLFEIMFLVPRRRARRFPDDFAARRSAAFQILKDHVAAAMAAGAFAVDDPLETALSLWAHGHGLIALHRAGRFADDVKRFRRIYRRSLQRLVRGLAVHTMREVSHGGSRQEGFAGGDRRHRRVQRRGGGGPGAPPRPGRP